MTFLKRIVLLFCCVSFPLMAAASSEPQPPSPVSVVNLELFTTSLCPYGLGAQRVLESIMEDFEGALRMEVHYIKIEKEPSELTQRDIVENRGNLLQLCAQKHAPKRFFDLRLCMGTHGVKMIDAFEVCAKEADVDVTTVLACADGEEGQRLQQESSERAEQKQIRALPIIALQGDVYRGGGRRNDVVAAICGLLSAEPKVCLDLPKPVEVPAIILTDARCKDCDRTDFLLQIKKILPKLQERTLDYSSEEGKKLFSSLTDGTLRLPLFLLDPVVATDPAFPRLARFLLDLGEFKMLKVEASFDPTAEICDNGIDDTGNGLVDCEDPSCKGQIVCRPENNARLDLFTMSHCPFGTRAVDAMQEVLKAFDGEIDFHIHYIGEDIDGDPISMHGPKEVEENIRQLCAIKHYGKKHAYMNYITCRNKNFADPKWKKCAKRPISVRTIERCSTSEKGRELLLQSQAFAEELDANASPTWLANNRFLFNAITAEQIRYYFCQANPSLKGCATQLSVEMPKVVEGCRAD